MLDLARDLRADPRARRLKDAARGLGAWLAEQVPFLESGWTPRRITLYGEPYPLTPEGGPDPIYDHSADGLYLLDLWQRLGRHDLARQMGTAFVEAGGLWGSLNHDTYDDRENVAYAVAFDVLRRAADEMDELSWHEFAYESALPAMARYRMHRNEHGVATRGLFWMETTWDTAYLWENAEVAQAHLEAWLEQGDPAHRDTALDILSAIARHHYGPLGFLTEGIDWNNHVTQRHHVCRDRYGAIRYTEPLLNNLHLVGPTLTYLQATGYDLAGGPDVQTSIETVNALSARDRQEVASVDGARTWLRLFYPVLQEDESVEDAIAFAHEAGIDGVMLFEASYDNDPALIPLDVLKPRFERLQALVPRFRAAGFEVQINVMITMGHTDGGGAHPEWFDWQFLVDEQGNTSRSTACPLDPAFVAYVTQIYRWAADCDADGVWVDDDVRFVSHDVPGMTCFCPLHLARMDGRLPQDIPWTREDLSAALQDDAADPAIREAWFSIQSEAMLELARQIERSIREVTPEQPIGLMSIGTVYHHAEGRDTDRLLRALAGDHTRPLLRPGSGYWHDWQPGDVLNKSEEVARQITFLGNDVRLVAEVENHPYSPFHKSLRLLGLEMALNVLAGTPEVSLNILPGTTSFERPETDVARFLRAQHPWLDALAATCAGKVRLGIGIEANEKVAQRMALRKRGLGAWLEPRPWETILARLGLPIGRPASAPHLLAGASVEAMDRYALNSSIQDGAILTPFAVRALIERGQAASLGIEELSPAPAGVNEQFTGDELNASHGSTVLPVRHYARELNPYAFVLSPSCQVRCLSRWLDVEGVDRGVAVAGVELTDGRRIGLLPFEIQKASHVLLCPARRDQWAGLFEWVGRSALPCRVVGGANLYPQLLVDPGDGSALLAVTNLSADDATARVSLPVVEEGKQAERLAETGEWVAESDPTQIEVAAWSVTVLRWGSGAMRNSVW